MVNHLGKTGDEIRTLGYSLMTRYREGQPSYEATAQHLVHDLYRQFTTPEGIALFALIRTFRLCRPHELPPEAFQGAVPPSGDYWLALAGTAGQHEDWNDRRHSKHHRLIPNGEFPSPMLKAVFEQLNLYPDRKIDRDTFEDMITLEERVSPTRYFYVEEALGNPNIVDQKTFVKPYGIHSVLGIGCPFLSGSFQITLFFSKVHLTQAEVRLFMQLAPFISALLATYDEKGRYWN